MSDVHSSFLKKLDDIALFFSKTGFAIASCFILFVTGMIFINVITRSFFNYNFIFAEEWASLSLVPMSYLGLGYTLRNDKHLAADIIISRVSEKTKYVFLFFIAVFSFFTLLFFVFRAWDVLSYNYLRNITTNGIMRTPLWIPSVCMFVGLIIFLSDIFFWIIHIFLKLRGQQGLSFVK